MALIQSTAIPSGAGYELEQSLKFDDTATSKLTFTPSSAGDKKKITVSVWVKRSNLGTAQYILSSGGRFDTAITFDTSDKIQVFTNYAENYRGIQTSAVFRDTSAWYHIVATWDTNNSTSTDRHIVWVNGVRQAVGSEVAMPQNGSTELMNTTEHTIGTGGRYQDNNRLDAYLAEMHIIDGAVKVPADFGETGTYGEWKPIEYEGTYGTNGFYLPFKQDYTVEGFSTVTWTATNAPHYIGGVGFKPDLVWGKKRSSADSHALIDSVRGPTKELSSNTDSAEATNSNGVTSFESDGFNMAVGSGSGSGVWNGNAGATHVAWCWDMDSSTRTKLNISAEGTAKQVTAQSKVPASSSSVYTPSGSANYVQLGSDGDIDFGSDNFTIEFWVKDGNGYFLSGYGGTHSIYIQQTGSSAGTIYINTSGGDGTISISPTWSNWVHIAIVRNSNTFTAYIDGTSAGTLTLSGTVSSSAYRLGRNGTDTADGSGYFDELRISNTARYTGNFTAPTTAFSEDANTLMLIHSLAPNNQTYILDGGSISTAGSINSSVMANPTYGQSIVSYTGNSTTGATVGHGLSSAPEMVIVKQRAAQNNWAVYFYTLADTQALRLQSPSAATTENWFNNTDPTSSVVELRGATTVNSGNMIMYCFHSVTGYSTIGSFIGNGDSRSTAITINCGFKPAFIIMKVADASSNRDWYIWDDTRSNPIAKHLRPNLSNAEAGEAGKIEFTSTGVSITTNDDELNANGKKTIYMVFADKREYAYWLDQSGNNNDWTSNNLTESDISVDSPTNNFSTFNPLDPQGTTSITFSEGNLKVVQAASWTGAVNNVLMTSGKWYWEVCGVDMSNSGMGVIKPFSAMYNGMDSANSGYFGAGDRGYGINFQHGNDLDFFTNTTKTTDQMFSSYSNGDIVQVAYDADTGKIWIGKNNTWGDAGSGTGNPATGANPAATTANPEEGYYAGFSLENCTLVANFGQDSSFAGNKTAQGNQDGNSIGDFYYTPPTGFLALCTKNLPDVDVVPSEHFNTVLWTGNGADDRSITGVGFQPDLVWGKGRSNGGSHRIADAVRGATKLLMADDTGAEYTSNAVKTFISDGFTTSRTGGNLNDNNWTFVAWNWKANGSGSSNTDGTINTTATSANVDAGFSIIEHSGNATANATIGHGLSKAPELVISKKREDNGYIWSVFVKELGNANHLRLDTTGASGDEWEGHEATTASVIQLSAASNASFNAVNKKVITYAWHSVEGYSKVGSYTGNGSTDGTFAYTGFRPAWVMMKSISANSWVIIDSKRDTHNQSLKRLYPDSTEAEYTATDDTIIDIVSNGFKHRYAGGNANANNDTVIYLAFAETPFKHSNAR